jgi:hypothetical protein
MLGGQSISWSAPPVAESAPTASGEVYRHLFTRGDGRRWLFLWTRERRTTVDVQLSSTDSRAIEFTLAGTPAAPLTIVAGRLPQIALQPGQVRFFEIVR